MRTLASLLFAGLLLVQFCAADTTLDATQAEILAKEPDFNINEDFYKDMGFERYNQDQGEPGMSTRADLPTIEEQREEEANKRGWFDPRKSQKWDMDRRKAAGRNQEVKKDAPVTPPAEKTVTPEAPKSDKPATEAPKSEKPVTPEAPKSENKAAEATPATEKAQKMPTLEEEREAEANKQGWFDPRVSQKWRWNSAYTQRVRSSGN